jgi:hypothetical protein
MFVDYTFYLACSATVRAERGEILRPSIEENGLIEGP